jgi:diazepam-binding inhibitor (GABA receptor modulator, acyl-CoA-binding protein)
MSLVESFQNAVADSKQITARPDNNTLLQLYSLYKQATEGDAPGAGPSNPFDFIAIAKHDAWQKLDGTQADDAMKQYIELVEKLKAPRA